MKIVLQNDDYTPKGQQSGSGESRDDSPTMAEEIQRGAMSQYQSWLSAQLEATAS